MSGDEKQQNKPNLITVFLSICSAFLGVQSDKNRISDFSSNSVWPFIIVALLFVFAFILLLVFIVKLILSSV